MSRAIALYEADRRQVALRADGQLFRRHLIRDDWRGFRWSVWEPGPPVLAIVLPDVLSIGGYRLRRVEGARQPWLPG